MAPGPALGHLLMDPWGLTGQWAMVLRHTSWIGEKHWTIIINEMTIRIIRRPMPVLQPDYKIFEMNKRLQHRNEDSDNLWWDAFANEFFDDEAQVTLTFCLEDGPKRYSKLTSSI